MTTEQLLLKFIKEQIKGTKFENNTFVAGGYVRDMVMNKQSKDIDIVVALPNGGIEFAEWITKKHNCYVPDSNPVIFPNFGTAKFNLRGVVYKNIDLSNLDIECVMTRSEQYKDKSRKPEVEFSTPKEDVFRRDLTINSLLYDISNEKILDLTGKGISDIKNKVIRTPIDSNIIFKDDPLRMLRAIRFTVRYGWNLSDDMIKSIKQNASMLENISKERIRDEFDKILISNNVVEGIRLLVDTQLMKYIIPEIYQIIGMEQNKYHEFDVYEHTLRVVNSTPPKLELRMAALFHDMGKMYTKKIIDGRVTFHNHETESARMVAEILHNLKYENSFISKVAKLVLYHMKTKQFEDDISKASDKAIRKLMNELGDLFEDLLDLIHADNISHGSEGWKYNMANQISNIRNKIKEIGNFTSKLQLPINGNHITTWLNIKPGKSVGIILNSLKDLYMEDPDKVNNMPDNELRDFVINMYKKISSNELNENIKLTEDFDKEIKKHTYKNFIIYYIGNSERDFDGRIVGNEVTIKSANKLKPYLNNQNKIFTIEKLENNTNDIENVYILMNKMIKYAKNLGYEYIILSAQPMYSGKYSETAIPLNKLIKFYEQFGFKVLSSNENYSVMLLKIDDYSSKYEFSEGLILENDENIQVKINKKNDKIQFIIDKDAICIAEIKQLNRKTKYTNENKQIFFIQKLENKFDNINYPFLLMDKAIKYANKLNFEYVLLEVVPYKVKNKFINMNDLIKFYEYFGFEVVKKEYTFALMALKITNYF